MTKPQDHKEKRNITKDGKTSYAGRILKGIGGFYTVMPLFCADDEELGTVAQTGGSFPAGAGAGLWECRLRGRFRKEKQDVLVGDEVIFLPVNPATHQGVINQILPRRNRLLRPAVANVDQALIVLAADEPAPDLWLLDKLLLMICREGIKPVVCWNKEDLAGGSQLDDLLTVYGRAAVSQVVTCALTGQRVADLQSILQGQGTVFAGPSGVGKSSLLNVIQPGLALQTGEVSDKLGRGKHTTRHVEWIPLSFGGWVADTPGFSQIGLPAGLTKEELGAYYADFAPYAADCRYSSCLHDQAAHCGVSRAAATGQLDAGRYERYLTFLEEIKGAGW